MKQSFLTALTVISMLTTTQNTGAQTFKTIQAGPLNLHVYSASEQAFGVVSTIVTGENEAILIDAQFSLPDAEKVVAEIRRSGKQLQAVYISHSDPDYYFGLQAIRAAFPQATVYASEPTVANIVKTAQQKLDFWGPKLGAAATTNIVLPQVLKNDYLELEGHRLEIKGLDGNDAAHSFVWVPDAKAIIGGVSLFSGLHLWTADAATPERKAAWKQKLDMMDALNPLVVIPAHVKDKAILDKSVISYNKKYLSDYESELAKAANSTDLIAAMVKLYPQAGLMMGLEIGAKVNKGEMKW
jgi:glyoxylase-like metal-dependent hydrolase (beta-lactamase superfamily II)